MNEATKAYIKECGPSIQKYWELHPEEQKWLYPLLHKSIRSAIAVLEAISDKPQNYSEIAAITELSENTVKHEKATSNICTNNSLCALTTAVYMASLGGTGMRELAQLNFDKAEYLKARLRDAGVSLPFGAVTFNEFVAAFPDGFDATYRRLIAKGIIAGLPLGPYYPALKHHYLLCVTETMSKEDLGALAREVTS